MRERTVEVTVEKPHLVMRQGYWLVLTCGWNTRLDKLAMAWAFESKARP